MATLAAFRKRTAAPPPGLTAEKASPRLEPATALVIAVPTEREAAPMAVAATIPVATLEILKALWVRECCSTNVTLVGAESLPDDGLVADVGL
eukprot:CAMPEP_0184680468 /NCGR_PEP_ID=MMETSP0312-20130426/3347_1 /TAXON_ID=31354 /ORGANISM="Compsopogon coeruleus, Strain SAG 36.94" /LENGTH=92 /DNA_ID=CAMNT_0027130587 /DNA_START=230 /DNA_END=508 /DNA_ORIENTATION=+